MPRPEEEVHRGWRSAIIHWCHIICDLSRAGQGVGVVDHQAARRCRSEEHAIRHRRGSASSSGGGGVEGKDVVGVEGAVIGGHYGGSCESRWKGWW